MTRCTVSLSLLFTAIVVFHFPVHSENIVCRGASGELFLIDVEADSSFAEAMYKVTSELELHTSLNRFKPEEVLAQNEYVLDFMERSESDEKKEVYAKSPLRDFNTPLQNNEKKIISHIVEILGNASLVTIAKEKSSISKAGKEVEHVHPLNFLDYIFSTEKLKAAIHNLNGRSWVWGKFFNGIKTSLEEEDERNNLLPYIKKFCASLKIDYKALYSCAEQHRWKEFMNVLFKEIPRSDNSGRYDM